MPPSRSTRPHAVREPRPVRPTQPPAVHAAAGSPPCGRGRGEPPPHKHQEGPSWRPEGPEAGDLEAALGCHPWALVSFQSKKGAEVPSQQMAAHGFPSRSAPTGSADSPLRPHRREGSRRRVLGPRCCRRGDLGRLGAGAGPAVPSGRRGAGSRAPSLPAPAKAPSVFPARRPAGAAHF